MPQVPTRAVAAISLANQLKASPTGEARPSEADKKRRLGICTWSLFGLFEQTRPKAFKWPDKLIDLLEFPELVAER